MGRPAKFDRTQALEIAMDLFWTKGYESTGVSELAAAIGITRSSFYNSFESRDQIFIEAMDHYTKIAPDKVLAGHKAGDPVLPILTTLFKDLARSRAADDEGRGCLIVNALAELKEGGQEPPLVRAMVEKKISRIESLLKVAQAQRELDPDLDTATLSSELVSFLIGLNTISKLIRCEEQLWAMAQSFLASHGLLARD